MSIDNPSPPYQVRGRPLPSPLEKGRRKTGGCSQLISYLLLIILLTFIAFSPVLKANFLNWDDDENVVYCEEIRSFSLTTIPWLFTNFTVGDFKPFTWLSYTLDYAIWGLNPFGYHLGNLLIHAGSSCLLFILFVRLGHFSQDAPGKTFLLASFFAALFFALHPLRVESVAWVSERKGLLCAFFYLAAVLAYSRYAGRDKVTWYFVTLLLACLALLSKPVAVSLPIVLLLLDIYPLERMRNGRIMIILEKIPFFIAAAATGIMAYIGQTRHAALASLQTFGFGKRVLLAAVNIDFYMYKTIVPFRLAAAYTRPEPIPITALNFLLVILPVVSITTAGILLWRGRQKWLLVCWLWFLITIFPVIGFSPAGLVVTADRWTYLPAAGISGIVFCALLGLFRTGRLKTVAICWAVILAAFAFSSFRQAQIWNNSEVLWSDTVKKYPDSPVARAHYGQILFERGADEEAIKQLQRAIALLQEKPFLAGDILFSVKTNLAQSLARRGRLEEAAAILENVLESKDTWIARHSLGGIYRRMNETEKASLEYTKVLEKRPDWVPTMCDYGLMIAQSGRPGEAMELYRRALLCNPGSPRARYNLSLAFLDLGDTERAITILQKLAAEYPDYSRTHRALAVAYSAAGKKEEAERTIQSLKGKNALPARDLPYGRGEKPGVLYPLR